MDVSQPFTGEKICRRGHGRHPAQPDRPALRQGFGYKLGAKIVVLPHQRQAKKTGQRPQQAVMVILPPGIHVLQPLLDPQVGLLRDLKLIKAAGYPWVKIEKSMSRPLPDQAGRQDPSGILSGKGIKMPSRSLHADGDMGIVSSHSTVNQPGKQRFGAGEQNINCLFQPAHLPCFLLLYHTTYISTTKNYTPSPV